MASLCNGDDEMKAYLVWNDEAKEGVVFSDAGDADYAATGFRTIQSGYTLGVSTLADEFREMYADDDEDIQFKVIEIELPE
jgi:hypothetical protein